MDRFRIRAIGKLLRADNAGAYSRPLAAGDRQSALAMLAEKCRILRLGTLKHGNDELLVECDKLINEFALQ